MVQLPDPDMSPELAGFSLARAGGCNESGSAADGSVIVLACLAIARDSARGRVCYHSMTAIESRRITPY
jgi:hypothetical protein